MTYTRADIKRMSCDNCGEHPGATDPFRRIEVDHVLPLNHPVTPGRDVEDNWQPLCGRCNRHKSVMTNAEARVARTLPDGWGVQQPWPRGFNWETETWNDGSPVGWVYGQLFTYPVRATLPGVRYADAV
jgi:hypothetical protein